MEELKQKLVDLCNESGLPLEAILFVTRDLMRDVEATLRELKEKQAQKEKTGPYCPTAVSMAATIPMNISSSFIEG